VNTFTQSRSFRLLPRVSLVLRLPSTRPMATPLAPFLCPRPLFCCLGRCFFSLGWTIFSQAVVSRSSVSGLCARGFFNECWSTPGGRPGMCVRCPAFLMSHPFRGGVAFGLRPLCLVLGVCWQRLFGGPTDLTRRRPPRSCPCQRVPALRFRFFGTVFLGFVIAARLVLTLRLGSMIQASSPSSRVPQNIHAPIPSPVCRPVPPDIPPTNFQH